MNDSCQLQGRSLMHPESFSCRHLCLPWWILHGSAVLLAYSDDSWIPLWWQICLLSFSCFQFLTTYSSLCGVWMQLFEHICFLEMLCCAETNASRLHCMSPTKPSLLCPGGEDTRALPLSPCWLFTEVPFLNRNTWTFFKIPSPSPCLGGSSQPHIGHSRFGQHGTPLRWIPLPLHGTACQPAQWQKHPQERAGPQLLHCTDIVLEASCPSDDLQHSAVTARLPIIFPLFPSIANAMQCSAAVLAVWQ